MKPVPEYIPGGETVVTQSRWECVKFLFLAIILLFMGVFAILSGLDILVGRHLTCSHGELVRELDTIHGSHLLFQLVMTASGCICTFLGIAAGIPAVARLVAKPREVFRLRDDTLAIQSLEIPRAVVESVELYDIESGKFVGFMFDKSYLPVLKENSAMLKSAGFHFQPKGCGMPDLALVPAMLPFKPGQLLDLFRQWLAREGDSNTP